MTKQIINVGATANDRNGDSLRAAFQKVNTNFTELYTALGLDVAPLNLGAFEFTNSIISTTDSTAITIDQATTVTSNLTVGGDILPQTANGGNLGSLGKPWNSLYVSNSTIYLGGIPLSVDVNGNLLVDGNLITGGGGSSVTTSATAPVGPSVGDLWYDTASGRTYVYYDSSWVDASPVDGAVSTSTNELVNGSHTVSLSSVGLTAFPAISNESLFIQASELGSANASIGISAKNSVIVTADILDTAKQWTFGTEGKLTLPAGTTFEYLNAPLTGHGDGLARLDFTLVTDGVETQWAAASASPAGSGYSPGNTFTFDEVFLGIPGASVTIEVLTVGVGGSVENLAFTPPPLYPADIYRDSPINLQVGPESNRWTFDANGKLTVPGTSLYAPSGGMTIQNHSEDGTTYLDGNGNDITLEVDTTKTIYVKVGNAEWSFGNAGSHPDSTLTVPGGITTLPIPAAGDIVSNVRNWDIQGGNGNEQVIWLDAAQTPALVTLGNFGDLTGWTVSVSDGNTATITATNPSGFFSVSTDTPLTGTGTLTFTSSDYQAASAEPLDITVGENVWSFASNGNLVIPGDLKTTSPFGVYSQVNGQNSGLYAIGGGNSILYATDDVFVRANNNGTIKDWTFNADGNLTLPQSGNIGVTGVTAASLANLETTYNDLEVQYQDALSAWMTIDSFTPVWYLLPGRLAYDEITAWTPPVGITLPSNIPPVAYACQNAYTAWQEALTNSKLTVKSDVKTWTFDSENKLTLSQGGVIAGGDPAAVQAAYDDWQADEAAWQTLITAEGTDLRIRPWTFAGPSRTEKLAVVLAMWTAQNEAGDINWTPVSSAWYNQVRSWLAITANQDGYDEWKKLTTSVNIMSEDKTWTFTNDGGLTLPGNLHGAEIFSPGPDSPISEGHRLNITPAANLSDKNFIFDIAQDPSGVFQSATLQLPTSENNKPVYLILPGNDNNTNSTVTLWNQNTNSGASDFNNAFNILANGKDIKLTAETSNGSLSTWKFGTDGNLTFPDNVSTISTLDPATSGGINGISISGKDRAYIGITNDAFSYGWDFRAFGLADYSTTLKPAIKFPGNGWLQEDYTDIINGNVPLQLGSQGSITLTATLGGMSPTEHDWVFGRDGRTTFPNGVVPEHSYGAAGDKEGMVVFSDPYIYYCKQDYVDDLTDIWVRVAWTGTNW